MKKFYLCLLTLFACNLAAQEWDDYPESLPHYWEAPDYSIYPAEDIWYFEEPGTWVFFKVNADQERIDLFQREIACSDVVEEREAKQSVTNIYPNPVNDFLYLDHNNNHGQIELLSMEGINVFRGSLNPGLQEYDLSHLTSGAYILILNGDFENSIHKVFVSSK